MISAITTFIVDTIIKSCIISLARVCVIIIRIRLHSCQGMEIENNMYTLFCEHSLLSNVRGDLTDILCTAINEVTNGQAIGAQKIKAVWAICVRDNDARETLCKTGMAVNGVHIPLYLNNPRTMHRVEGERVVIKDLPLWESDSLLGDFFRSHPNVGEFSKIFRSTTRNKFLNGDRFIYMKLNPNVVPPIAHRIQIGEYDCRVQYSSMNQICERCKRHGHKTSDTKKCEAFEPSQENVHYITNGILSNFGECNMKFEDIDFMSSEHAYQWNACIDQLRDDLAENVIKSKTPREAKEIASAVKETDSNWHKIKYDVMERVLKEKANCSEKFRKELLSTGTKLLIEPRQDLWWGSGLSFKMTSTTKPSYHPGKSWLGEILMKIRSQLISKDVLNTNETSKCSDEVRPADAPVLCIEPPTHPRRGRSGHTHNGSKKRSRSFENKFRSTSISPSRLQSLKGKKVDTPMLKDLLRKQVKQTLIHTDIPALASCSEPPSVSALYDGKESQVINS